MRTVEVASQALTAVSIRLRMLKLMPDYRLERL
jgi:hypothetical protein